MSTGISLNGTSPVTQKLFSVIEQPKLSSLKEMFDFSKEITPKQLGGILQTFNTFVDSLSVFKNAADGNISDVLKSVSGLTETFLDQVKPSAKESPVSTILEAFQDEAETKSMSM